MKPQRSWLDPDRMKVGQGILRQCPQNPVKKKISGCNQEEAQLWNLGGSEQGQTLGQEMRRTPKDNLLPEWG